MIHVAYGLCDLDGHYSKFCGTSILSLFENTREEVTVHILHDKALTDDNREKFRRLAEQYHQRIFLYDIDICAPDHMRYIRLNTKNMFTSPAFIGSFYRLVLAVVIDPSIKKIVYIDAGDTIVNLDIKELWDVELGDHPLAAAIAINKRTGFTLTKNLWVDGWVERDKYFNAGVLVINLDRWRADIDKIFGGRREGGFEFYCKHFPRYGYADQDILNYCFANDTIPLADKFNCGILSERQGPDKSVIREKLYHFAGVKPDFDTSDVFNRLYLEYFMKTPWFNVDSFGALFNELRAQENRQKNFLIHLINLFSERRRAFAFEQKYLEACHQIFRIKEGEPIYFLSLPTDLDQLIEIMQEAGGGWVFFLFASPSDMKNVRSRLAQQKFVENVDYIDAIMLLGSKIGVPFECKDLFKAM